MSSIYAEHPLQDAKDIRILSLQPAEHLGDALRGDLKVVNLTSSSDFEALSYTWGPPFEKQVLEDDIIEISEQMLSITGNLSHALRRLRLPTAPTALWVDAICIDQGDSKERGHQVRFMAAIFGSAFRVLAWLGEDSEHRDGQWFFEYRCNTERFFRESKVDKAKLRESSGLDSEHRQLSDWRILGRVFQARRYFSRRWVLQEQIVARDIVLICGESRRAYTDFLHDVSSHPCRLGRLNLVYKHGVEKARRSSVIEIVRMLKMWECAKCSDDRDIILALASLWRNIDLRVDYSMPTKAIYAAFAEAIVHSISNSKGGSTESEDPEMELRKLLSNAAFQRPNRSSLPSWVPDWRRVSEPFPRIERGSVKLNAKVTSEKKLQLTVVYFGELCSQETDTEVPETIYYLLSETQRTEKVALCARSSLDRLRKKYNKSVDGAMICSVLSGTNVGKFTRLLLLQPVNRQEQEYKIIGNTSLDQPSSAMDVPSGQERRITIV